MAALVLAISGCGGDETGRTDPSTDPGEEAARVENEMPAVRIEVLGTAEKPPRDGFVRIDSDCTDGTSESPRLGPLDLQVPAAWEIRRSGGGGPRRADMGFTAGGVRRTISVGMRDQSRNEPPPTAGGEGAEEVGRVSWGGVQVPVVFGPGGYSAYFPIITVDDRIDVYAHLRVGGRGSGDLATLDPDAVLGIFETARLDPCAVESFAGTFNNAEVVFLDDG